MVRAGLCACLNRHVALSPSNGAGYGTDEAIALYSHSMVPGGLDVMS